MKRIRMTAVVAAGLRSPVSSADIRRACAGDIAGSCASVRAGHGRLASCLDAPETVISAG